MGAKAPTEISEKRLIIAELHSEENGSANSKPLVWRAGSASRVTKLTPPAAFSLSSKHLKFIGFMSVKLLASNILPNLSPALMLL